MKRAKGTECCEPREYLFRYADDYTFSPAHEGQEAVGYGEDGPVYVHLVLRRYVVHSKTPCGIWIYRYEFPQYRAKLKFVKMRDIFSGETIRRWAHPTREAALASYIARKKHQLGLLAHQKKRAESGLAMAEEIHQPTPMAEAA